MKISICYKLDCVKCWLYKVVFINRVDVYRTKNFNKVWYVCDSGSMKCDEIIEKCSLRGKGVFRRFFEEGG